MPLPDGLRQDGEGLVRCAQCGGEVVRCRQPDGTAVALTPMGNIHQCAQWSEILMRAKHATR